LQSFSAESFSAVLIELSTDRSTTVVVVVAVAVVVVVVAAVAVVELGF
jgi:hypothetical protein